MPYDEDMKGYNIQGLGIAKAFCRWGYDCDFVAFKRKNQTSEVFYEYNGCKARFIEMPRFRFIRWGINLDVCKDEFLSQYDYIIGREYYQITAYSFFAAQTGRRGFSANIPGT